MSQSPKKRPPVRRVVTQTEPVEAAKEEEYYLPDEPQSRQQPQSRKELRSSQAPPRTSRGDHPQYEDEYQRGRRDYPRGGANYRPRSVAPRRDPFPIILGALMGALIVGLVAVVFLLVSRSNGGITTPNTSTSSSNSNSSANTVPTLASAGNQPTQQSSSSGSTPPRMPLADFKALYDDPAKRPLVIDVRAQDAYETGHIKGSFSAPESDIDALAVKIPKDKLVVAYCQ